MRQSSADKELYRNFGIYVHVPFCASACGYCRFYKKVPGDGDVAFYLKNLEAEADKFRRENPDCTVVDTMFWGGGTPSILSPEDIRKMGKIFEGLSPSKEWTVEVSPSTLTSEKLDAYKSLGVTRISLGVQSFNENTLKRLGRRHSLSDTLKAIDLVASKNFEHFSIDLIFGSAGQSVLDFETDLRRAAASPVDHISAYCLEFESGTSSCAGEKTAEWESQNARQAELFELAMSRLPELGFGQYEISNYAKTPQSRCLHNLCTWHMAQWRGFGPAAASQFGGLRFRNPASVKKWADALSGASAMEDVVVLDDCELYSSALIFGLRLNDGVDLAELKSRFPGADENKYAAAISNLCQNGLLEKRNSRLLLTKEGRLYADSVAVDLL